MLTELALATLTPLIASGSIIYSAPIGMPDQHVFFNVFLYLYANSM